MHENNISSDRRLLSEKEARAELRISKVTLWRLRTDGKIGYRRIGKRIFYTADDIDAFVHASARGLAAVAGATA